MVDEKTLTGPTASAMTAVVTTAKELLKKDEPKALLECVSCHNRTTLEEAAMRAHYPGHCGHCGNAFKVVRT